MTGNPRNGTANAPRDLLERQPPANVDAEKCVLGSVLIAPDCIDDLALLLRPSDFYDGANQQIFQHMLALSAAGKPVDVTLLVDALKKAGHYDLVGGIAYLGELTHIVPSAASAAYYADLVAQASVRRSIILASGESLTEAYDQGQDTQVVLAAAEQRLFAIGERDTTVVSRTIADVLQEALARISDRASGGGLLGTPTGFCDLDHMMGGLHPATLTILAARPSMGKSALALNIAEHVACEQQVGTLIVSLEMNAIELADRLLCSMARVNSRFMRDGSLTAHDRQAIVQASAEISNAPLCIDDAPGRTMTQIAAMARRHKRRNELGLLVIDYLQLIEPDDPRDPRQEQVAKIARRLKNLARELNVPVLCLAQLNRQTELARDNRPRLSHLRESGAIEQDADVVMFIHREEYYATTEEAKKKAAGEADLIVAKQRSGPIGDVKLTWLEKYTRFTNAAPQRDGYDEFSGDTTTAPAKKDLDPIQRRKDLF